MPSTDSRRPLSIFVHSASECLTDHASHGDGLICFSLLNGLAERGHEIFAYANSAPINDCSPRLHVKTSRHLIPANSLAQWEHSYRAERWLRELLQTKRVDMVWRMHPYGFGCPATFGRPLVIGPLFYGWPATVGQKSNTGRPRFGIGIRGLIKPAEHRGWLRALERADLVMCATKRHAEEIRAGRPNAPTHVLPVIVTPRGNGRLARTFDGQRPVRLIFVANLLDHKRPDIFCGVVRDLVERGIDVQATILGDGPARPELEDLCATYGITSAIDFLGSVPNDCVYSHVQEADFLISTSFGEPYGRNIVEAMSVGTPCICHQSGGPADYIAHGENGLLVSDLESRAYVDAIENVVRVPRLWEQLSRGAVESARLWRKDIVLADLERMLRDASNHGAKGAC